MRVTTEATAGHISLDPMGALRQAWNWYIGFLLMPIVLFIAQGLLLHAGWRALLTPEQSRLAYVITLVWIGISGSLGFLGQGRFFRRYYTGNVVHAHDYLHGKLFVWTMLSSGALLASVFVVLSHSFLPHITTLVIIYPFLLTQYPQGRAMTSHNGNSIHAALYSEPK